ncbi:hypothetical protein [Acaryochloris thomasi]|uniref:hypothetical protein n=1 Tax=Acaryochloris thomasi TaxID=2929456 RepID=UPI001314743A|nr:hypothetical protein [Acaryochloris thomasi]
MAEIYIFQRSAAVTQLSTAIGSLRDQKIKAPQQGCLDYIEEKFNQSKQTFCSI